MSEMEQLFLSLVRKKMMMEDLENSINNNCSHTPLSHTTSADTYNARSPTSVQLHLTHSPLRPQSLRHQPPSPPTASDVTSTSSSSFYRSFSSVDADVTSPVSSGSCFSRQTSACSAASDAESTGGGRYKTELCRPFEENGTCRYGDKCQFAHGRAELRLVQRHPKYKTEMCKTFHTTGLCPYGPRCHFIHNDDERRGGGDAPSGGSNAGSCWDVYRDDRDQIKSLPSTGVDRRRLLQRMTSLQPRPSQYDSVSSNPCATSRLLQRQMSYVEPRCQSLPESVTQLIAGYSSCLLSSALPASSSNYPHPSLVNTQPVICPPRCTLGSSADSPSPSSSATDSPPPLSPPVNDQLSVTSLTDEDAFLLKRQLLNASLQSNDELYGDLLALLLAKINRPQS